MPIEPINAKPNELAAQNAEFACDLLRELHTKPDENIFFSPHSLAVALGMAWAGARGPTSDVIAGTMHWTLGQDLTHDSFAALANRLAPPVVKEGKSYEWTSANRIWPGIRVNQPYEARLRQSYGSDVEPLDFKDMEDAARRINAWCEKWTQGRINKIVDASDLDGIVMMLTNAVYFKGTWTMPFETANTRDEVFHAAPGKDLTVPMMNANREVLYAKGDGLAAISLPYVGGMSCVIILPDEGKMEQTVAGLSGAGLSALRDSMRPTEAVLAIPKLKARTQFSVREPLTDMGMGLAFSDAADFGGISTDPPVAISEVLHAATVELDEEGTVATAVTAIGVRATSAPILKEIPVFRVDRPYLISIIHDGTGSVLFLGRIVDPGKK